MVYKNWVGLSLVLISILLVTSFVSAPISSIQTVQAQTDDIAEIEALVDNMEAAVLAGDGETYRSYVDFSDENFSYEHNNWIRDWAEADEDWLTKFSLKVSNLRLEDNNTAIGIMHLEWATIYEHNQGALASYAVQFVYDEEAETWLYAGEYWITTATEHFLVHATPGLEDMAGWLIPLLPEIYDEATENYGHVPQRAMEIKIYNSAEALVGNTVMSLPLFRGWNEPSESLKIIASDPQALTMIVAHEFTHFLTFDQANHMQPRIPWWLNEGIAQYIAEPFDERGDQFYLDYRLLPVKEWTETDTLADWSQMSDFWNTDVAYWQYAYPQGYAFVRFVTEIYGPEIRNAWLASMAVDMDIEEATQFHFDMSFAELEARFRGWIVMMGEAPDPIAK